MKKFISIALILLLSGMLIFLICIPFNFAQEEGPIKIKIFGKEEQVDKKTESKDSQKVKISDEGPKKIQIFTDTTHSLEEGLARKISLDLRGMDIIEVFKFLAKEGGLNLAVSKEVKGRITLLLNNVPIGDVLEVILLTNDLAYEKKENILTIITEDEYQAFHGKKYGDKKEVETIKLQFADAGKVLSVMSELKSEIGKVIADPDTATVILVDTPEKIALMKKSIADLDLPTITRQLPTVTQTFELSYAVAKDIEPVVTAALTENVGKIRVDERTNKIIVTDLKYNMPIITKIIQEFDAKTREVFVESKIVEITLDDEFHSGIDWEKIFAETHNVTFEGNFPYSGTTKGTITAGSLNEDKYTTTIDLLETLGEAKTISSPHIIVVNNQEAKFMVGTREAYVTSTTTQSGDTSTVSESVEFIDVGISLSIVATINKDGFVRMRIKPEISSTGTPLTTSQGNEIPIVDTSNVETDVLIKDGRTLMIAGLIKETKDEDVNQVPFLGRIPFLGKLFGSTSRDNQRKETVIFLTPHIITGEESLGRIGSNY